MTSLTLLPHQPKWMFVIPSYVRAFAMRRYLAAASVSVAVLVARIVLALVIPTPQAAIQDEFSNLLLADTFASGRLTNPTHPLWIHFETVHVLSQPTYVSKYPPLPGLLMAAGQVVFGAPWVAVWLTMSLFCGVLCWTLQGFLPPLWALIGALIAAVRVGIVSYWTESYWGGTHGALAGALVIGALPRLMRSPDWRPTLVYACGLALLANGRPYEGIVLGIVTAPVVFFACRTSAARFGWKPILRQVLIPVGFVFIPTITWMAYYNYRTTGDMLRPPYLLHESKYAVWSMFLFADPKPVPTYNHEALRSVWVDWDGKAKAIERSHPVIIHLVDILNLSRFFVGIPLAIAVAGCSYWLWLSPRTRIPVALLVLFYAGMALLTRLLPHYVSPATALIYILTAATLRALWLRRAFSVVALGLFIAAVAPSIMSLTDANNRFLFDKRAFLAKRERILGKLNSSPGDHLVITRYGPKHDVNEEWVYNRADIDRARIVWAHGMGERDKELLDYYPRRNAWVLEDNGELVLKPYTLQHHQTVAKDAS